MRLHSLGTMQTRKRKDPDQDVEKSLREEQAKCQRIEEELRTLKEVCTRALRKNGCCFLQTPAGSRAVCKAKSQGWYHFLSK